jgi:hypothetical protein
MGYSLDLNYRDDMLDATQVGDYTVESGDYWFTGTSSGILTPELMMFRDMNVAGICIIPLAPKSVAGKSWDWNKVSANPTIYGILSLSNGWSGTITNGVAYRD